MNLGRVPIRDTILKRRCEFMAITGGGRLRVGDLRTGKSKVAILGSRWTCCADLGKGA